MNWTEGYASDIPYTAGFYAEQSPLLLNFVCLLNQCEPVDLDQAFTYCELGSGRGLTANVLAAAYPQGQFYAADFNPAHVGGALALARGAQLDNLHLMEESFEDLAAGSRAGLPQFDFITLHGIYTWVNAQNQAHIVAFIKRYLKPGGIAYVSYNAMPGWTDALPMQRLLWQYAQATPGSSAAQIQGAARLMQQMETLKAGYFAAHPGLHEQLLALENSDSQYLVHEYMHKHWQPLYHADVVEQMASAKLSYVGSADLPLNYLRMFMDEPRHALLSAIDDPVLRETAKDCFFNTRFRKDVFVRGARHLSRPRQVELIDQMCLCLNAGRDTIEQTVRLPYGEVRVKAEVYQPVLAALREGPHSLAQLRALPALAGMPPGSAAEVASLLVASGHAALAMPVAVMRDTGPARRLNRVLAGLARYSPELRVLCAPMLGSGMVCTQIDLLAYEALSGQEVAPPPAELAQRVWSGLKAQGRCMQRNGKNLETEADNLEEIALALRQISELKLPLWRRLGIL